MFQMMNEARIGVGTCATALGYTGYLKSLGYARERPQGRPLLPRDPAAGPVAIIEHPDVRRMLLAQKAYVEGALALVLFCGRLADDAQRCGRGRPRPRPASARHPHPDRQELAGAVVPRGQLAGDPDSRRLRILRDYDVEQHYRDNRLNAIHEGTHGIQALDLLGRKVAMEDGAAFRSLISAMRQTIDRARDARGAAGQLGEELEPCVASLCAVTASLRASPDDEAVLGNATAYLEATGHVVVARLWLEQLLALDPDADADIGPGKLQAARFFFRYELPKVGAQFALLERMDRTVIETKESWL